LGHRLSYLDHYRLVHFNRNGLIDLYRYGLGYLDRYRLGDWFRIFVRCVNYGFFDKLWFGSWLGRLILDSEVSSSNELLDDRVRKLTRGFLVERVVLVSNLLGQRYKIWVVLETDPIGRPCPPDEDARRPFIGQNARHDLSKGDRSSGCSIVDDERNVLVKVR